jgi:hypothetical protein
MDNKYENSGNLFPANNTEIVRQGKVDIEGLDHELVIAKTVTPKKGMIIFEVYKQVGVLYINEDKTENKDWDISGELEINGEKQMCWGRKKTDKNGNDYTRLGFAPSKDSVEKYKDKEGEPQHDNQEEDVPF